MCLNFPLPDLQVQCIPCPVGTFCATQGLSDFSICPPNSYQVGLAG